MFARRTAATVYGVVPEAAMPTIASSAFTSRFTASIAASSSSSAPSTAAKYARSPPAMSTRTRSRVDAVRRRQLGGVEHGDASARAGAGVEEASAVAQALGDLIDGVRDALGLRRHRGRDERVLLLNDPNDLERRPEVDVEARVEPVLTHVIQL